MRNYLAALQRMHEQMVKEQEEIDRLNAENQATLACLQEQMDKAVGKERAEQIRNLTGVQLCQYYEVQLQQEREAWAREKQEWEKVEEKALWLENQQLRERLAQLE